METPFKEKHVIIVWLYQPLRHPYKKYSKPPEQHVFQKIKHVFASPCPVDTSFNEEI